MRTFFGWALFNAALLGWSGNSYAQEYDLPSSPDAEVTFQSGLFDDGLADSSPSDSGLYEVRGNDCGPRMGSCFDNTVIFAGADIYKSIGDRITNINGGTGGLSNSFGGVTGFNTGFGVGECCIRGQIGASYGAYDPKGRIRLVPQSTETEEQQFVTAGIYKRGDMLNGCDPISFGLVVDSFWAEYWGVNANTIHLGQLRGIVGYALSDWCEVGTFGTVHLWDDDAAVTSGGAPGVRREIRAANQLNGYIRRNTAFGGSLMAYAGGFDHADIQSWQFGLTGQAPLSCHCAMYGNFNYAAPSATDGPSGSGEEQFNIQFGLAYFFGGKAQSRSVTGQRGLPLLNVANNGSFLITD